MAPFDGPPVLHLGGDHTGADAGAEEHDHGVAGAASGPEPHLGLAQGLGAVVDEVRDLVGQPGRRAEQPFQRDRVPADGLAVHDGAPVRGVLDDAGNADADAEQPLGHGLSGAEDLGDAVADMAGDHLDVVAPLGGQPAFGAGEFGQGQVEQLDADAGFADVDADHLSAVRGDAQQGAGPAAVGVDAAGLLDQAVRDQVGDHVADRAAAQCGGRAQLEPAEGTVEVQLLQHGRAVAPPEVAYRAPVAPRHAAPFTNRVRPATYPFGRMEGDIPPGLSS